MGYTLVSFSPRNPSAASSRYPPSPPAACPTGSSPGRLVASGALEVVVDLVAPLVVFEMVGAFAAGLALGAHALLLGPLGSHVLDPGLEVGLGVVGLADAHQPLPEERCCGWMAMPWYSSARPSRR